MAIDVNALIKQAEAEGSTAETKNVKKKPSIKLPAGTHVENKFNINAFDPRFPNGFVDVVVDDKGNTVGFVQNGKVMPKLMPDNPEEQAAIQEQRAKAKSQSDNVKTAQISSFQYAQSLQSTAEEEYNNLMSQAKLIARGNASPDAKQELENTAKQYESTLNAIKSGYQKSGAINGNIAIDNTGKLAEGTSYVDPAKPEAGAMVVTKTGVQPAQQPNEEQATKNFLNQANQTIPLPGSTPLKTPTGNTASTGPTGSIGSTSTSTGTGTATGYGKIKGLVTYNGAALTGYNPNDGKYYNNGKLETDAQVKEDFLANYGEQAKFIMSIPELGGKGGLLDQAINNNWALGQWQAAFSNSKWAQANPGDVGLAEIKRLSTPKQYNIEYNSAYDRAQALAQQLGVKLTPQQMGQRISDAQMEDPNAAHVDPKAISSGQDIVNWIMQNPNASDSQIQQHMAKYGTVDPLAKGGQIAASVEQLKSLAQQYGVYGQYNNQNGGNYFDQYALAMAQGDPTKNMNAAMEEYKNVAMNTYKPFASQIAAGSLVSDLAKPYTNTLANLLEIDPSEINLGDTTGYGQMVSKAMLGDGTAATNPIDFANSVRALPQWQGTNNAKSTLLDLGNQLISSFGFKGGY